MAENDQTRDRGRESSRGEQSPLGEESAHSESERVRLMAMHRRHIQRKKAREAGGDARIPSAGGAQLDNSVRQRMEGQLGAELSDVRVYTSSESAAAADRLGARAFTTGRDVHFNAGEFAPGTREGDRLLAHELTHAVQAQQSGVQRKASETNDRSELGEEAGGAGHEVSNPGDSAEQEADAVADRATDNLHGGGPAKAEGQQPAIAKPAARVGRKIFRTKKTGDDKDASHSTDKKDEKHDHDKKDDKPAATAWKPGDPLPHAASAVIDAAKFVSYSMDPGNKGNQGKAVAFKQIGYPVDDEKTRQTAAADVISQLRGALAKTPATAGKTSDFGQRFEVRVPVTGPKGAGTLVTAWQIDKGAEAPRLITNWLEVHK